MIEYSTWLLVDCLIGFPPFVLKIGLFGHANEYDEGDRDTRSQRAIRTHGRDRLHDRIKGVEADDHFLVLQKERNRKEGERSVAGRLDLVGRGHLLLSARLVARVDVRLIFPIAILVVQRRYDRQAVLDMSRTISPGKFPCKL